MNRRRFVAGAPLAAAAATTLAAPAIAQTAPELRWRMASSFPKSLDTIYGAGEHVTKRVAALTDGKFQIRPFAAGEIVGGLQVLDAVQNGTVECGYTLSSYYVGKDPAFMFEASVPFGLNTRQQNAWMYEAGGIDLLNEVHRKFNVMGMPLGATGAQMGGWFRRALGPATDLNGLKMRIGGLAGQVLSRLGGVPQQLGAGG